MPPDNATDAADGGGGDEPGNDRRQRYGDLPSTVGGPTGHDDSPGRDTEEAANGRQQQGLRGTAPTWSRRAEGSAQSDLAPVFEDGDDHHVGDAEPADDRATAPRPTSSVVSALSAAARAAKPSDGRLTLMWLGSAGFAVRAMTD